MRRPTRANGRAQSPLRYGGCYGTPARPPLATAAPVRGMLYRPGLGCHGTLLRRYPREPYAQFAYPVVLPVASVGAFGPLGGVA